MFTVQACVYLLVAVGFAILDRTADLNGFAGMWVFTVSFVLAVGAIIWLRRRQRSDDR